ncbi:MAG: saccharopine dehydrogenase NADP-binding domain-containing protein [Deltaproteobacteria bacterium]|nr:saccharopine dehydrogenase NADP-binding domain-containing protein [Deltaproteobacteria bacterium]
MSKVVVLGGGGGIGRVVVRSLAHVADFDEIVVADARLDAARESAAQAGAKARAVEVDATSAASLERVLAGARVGVGCIGPFYRFGPPMLAAALAARVDWVDVCDDLEPTRKMLELDGAAKAAGVSAVVGMGNSPGLANVFVRLCADALLDSVESVDIYHAHGGEPDEGPAVLKHRIHAMTNDVPLFIDGQMMTVRQLEESGRAHVVDVDFRGVGTLPVFPYPHPETITLPRNIPGLKRATNMGVVFPLSYFRLTQEMVRVGACTETPLEVNGQKVVPLDFSVAHVLSQRARLLREAGVTGPAGCLKVVVSGLRRGEPTRYELSISSREAGAGEGTGIPAAVGAILAARGAVLDKGVLAPEVAYRPYEVLTLAMEIVGKLGVGGGDTLLVEKVDAKGERTVVPLSMG